MVYSQVSLYKRIKLNRVLMLSFLLQHVTVPCFRMTAPLWVGLGLGLLNQFSTNMFSAIRCLHNWFWNLKFAGEWREYE